jgi:hypothetical protein
MAAARSGLLAACLLLGLCLGPPQPVRAVESGSEWNEGLEEFFHKVDRDGDGQIGRRRPRSTSATATSRTGT